MKMYTGIKKVDDFLDIEIKECIRHEIKVDMADVKSLKKGNFGTFDEDVLRVAINNPVKKWLPVFVHESCHKDQYLEGAKVWDTTIQNVDSIGLLNAWLQNLCELTRKQMTAIINKIIAVELDCEIRSVKKIQHYNLPIDTTKYIKEANAYIWYHFGVAKSRKWQCGNFLAPKILKMMPDHFSNDYSRPPEGYLKLLLKE